MLRQRLGIPAGSDRQPARGLVTTGRTASVLCLRPSLSLAIALCCWRPPRMFPVELAPRDRSPTARDTCCDGTCPCPLRGGDASACSPTSRGAREPASVLPRPRAVPGADSGGTPEVVPEAVLAIYGIVVGCSPHRLVRREYVVVAGLACAEYDACRARCYLARLPSRRLLRSRRNPGVGHRPAGLDPRTTGA